jgi:anti-sigma factor RsiW
MCDFNGRLIAWMDGELAENEVATVEQHVQACAECRGRVSAYEDVSRGFAAYHSATTQATTMPRKVSRWVPYVAAVAAVVLIALALWPRPVKQAPEATVVQVPAPNTVGTVDETVVPIQERRVVSHNKVAHKKTPHANFAMAEPAIQIAIPAEAMFPPGAVPEGVTYVANLSFAADGSVQGLRLHP